MLQRLAADKNDRLVSITLRVTSITPAATTSRFRIRLTVSVTTAASSGAYRYTISADSRDTRSCSTFQPTKDASSDVIHIDEIWRFAFIFVRRKNLRIESLAELSTVRVEPRVGSGRVG